MRSSATVPKPNGSIGRNARGQFAPGNPGGPGSPYAKRVAELRAALLDSVSADHLRDIITAMVDAAKNGDVAAAKLVLDRCLGNVDALDLLVRVEDLEARIGGESRETVSAN